MYQLKNRLKGSWKRGSTLNHPGTTMLGRPNGWRGLCCPPLTAILWRMRFG